MDEVEVRRRPHLHVELSAEEKVPSPAQRYFGRMFQFDSLTAPELAQLPGRRSWSQGDRGTAVRLRCADVMVIDMLVGSSSWQGDAISGDFDCQLSVRVQGESVNGESTAGSSPSPLCNPTSRQPNIADAYVDLMKYLNPAQRRGLTSRLAIGFYEGWRPSRGELADLIAVELGVLTWDESAQRSQERRAGREPKSIVGRLEARRR